MLYLENESDGFQFHIRLTTDTKYTKRTSLAIFDKPNTCILGYKGIIQTISLSDNHVDIYRGFAPVDTVKTIHNDLIKNIIFDIDACEIPLYDILAENNFNKRVHIPITESNQLITIDCFNMIPNNIIIYISTNIEDDDSPKTDYNLAYYLHYENKGKVEIL